MKTKIIIVALFVVAIVGIVVAKFALTKDGGDKAGPSASASASGSGSAKPPANVVEVTMIYSTDKKDWIDQAAVKFRADHPEIKLTLIGKGSLDAAQSIVDEKDKPTIFSPADSLIMQMTISDWKTKGKGDLFGAGDEAPQSLVITPLVFVIWEDRAQVLLKSANGKISWKTIQKEIASNKGWPSIGGKTEWGFMKLGHTDPTKSNSGLQALYLMSLEYYGKPTLDVGDHMKPEYQAYMKDIEKGVTKFEPSTGTFMTEMVRFGPSKYDIAVVYENLAISQLEAAQGRWGHLRVYYPATTLWSDHPAGVLKADWVTPAQREAGHKWLDYLRSKEVQQQALALGFRPGDTSIPVKTADPANPWTKLAQYGVQVDIPPVAKTPEGPVVHNLLTLWSRTVQK